MQEFELIQRYFKRSRSNAPTVELGIGDDAALVRIPDHHELAISVDTMVEGVHFPVGAPAHAVGYRALATNLSDLAAMGATPAWATLALTLPDADEAWLEAFSQGFFELAERFNLQLIGGDMTRGPLSVTVGIHGFVPVGQALRRDRARVGDLVFVTGALGAGAAGLKAYPAASDGRSRYLYPRPRVAEGEALRQRATAAIDISDGLLADLKHIVKACGVGADISIDRVPVAADCGASLEMALTGGDDYELCFTVDPADVDALRKEWLAEWASLTEIGTISAQPGIRCINPDGSVQTTETSGYQHF